MTSHPRFRSSVLGRWSSRCARSGLAGIALSLALAAGLGAQPAHAQTRAPSLVVLSSLPDVMVRPLIAAFEQNQPGLRIELVSVRAADFSARIRERQVSGDRSDLVLSGSVRALEALARESLLSAFDASSQVAGERAPSGTVNAAGTEAGASGGPVAVTRVQLPLRFVLQWGRRGEASSSTPASVGWRNLAEISARGKLAGEGVQPPEALALLAEFVLQAEGWQPGWRWIAQFVGNRAASDTPATARGADGLSLVLLGLGASMGESAVPVLTVTVPARVSVLTTSRDVRLSQRLVRFLAAQMLLERQEGLARAGGSGGISHRHDYLNIDGEQLEQRYPLVESLLEQTLVTQQPQLRRALERLDDAAARAQARGDGDLARTVNEARSRVLAPPMAESDLKEAGLRAAFGEGLTETVRRARVDALEAQWRERARNRYAQAERDALALIEQTR